MSEHRPIGEHRPAGEHRSIEFVRHDGPARKDIVASIEKVRGVLEQLRFGSITLTVHDARVVQIDVTEKTRLGA